MSAAVPTRIGPYDVVSVIGSGGMGEVYRGRDSRLDREVALKVLPDVFQHDADRLARFEREAKTLAALNHPHIAQIYGLEESGSIRALVMELVEGEDLSTRLSRGPLPLDDGLAIAHQIAEALEAAHEIGIIHRDLKPSNIRVRSDGSVKVLDFGLAKAFDVSSGTWRDQTVTSPAVTARGAVLGTAAYMSPEQARGRPVDKRVDIWAFGVVLYEMLTGARLFDADSVAETMSLVMTREIDLARLPDSVPPRVRTLLIRCLERDPRRRLRDIGEARLLLENVETAPAQTASPHSARKRHLLPTAAGVALISAGAAAVGYYAGSRGNSTRPAVWQSFSQLTNQAGEETNPAIAPDASSIAYASRARGTLDIYAQRLGGRNPIVVAGDPARHESAPAFSPDGLSIAFHESDRDGGIFIVGASGESVRRLTEFGFNPSWAPDSKRLVFCTEEVVEPFVRHSTSALWTVGVNGENLQKIHDGDAIQPAWSPDGNRIAFWANVGGQRDLFTIPAAGGPPAAVLTDAALDWSPAWSPDSSALYFSSDRGGSMNVWRVSIDRASGRAGGPAEPVTSGVHTAADSPSVSRDGNRVVFRAHARTVNPAVMPFDPATERFGELRLLIDGTGSLSPTSVSPDGQWLLLTSLGEKQDDVFVSRTDGTGLRRLTDDVHRDRWPRWSTDGTHAVFYSNRSGRYQIWTIKSDGSGLRQVSDAPDPQAIFPAVSPDGRRFVASAQSDPRAWIGDLTQPWNERTARQLTGLGTSEEWLLPFDWSLDGRRLTGPVVSKAGLVRGVGVYDLAAGIMRKVTDEGEGYGVVWLPDGRRVLRIDGGERAFVLDVDSGKRRPLTLPAGVRFVRSPPPAISRDGRSVYFGQVHTQADIWIVRRD